MESKRLATLKDKDDEDEEKEQSREHFLCFKYIYSFEVSRWIGLKILILKPPWKSKIEPMVQILGKNEIFRDTVHDVNIQ